MIRSHGDGYDQVKWQPGSADQIEILRNQRQVGRRFNTDDVLTFKNWTMHLVSNLFWGVVQNILCGIVKGNVSTADMSMNSSYGDIAVDTRSALEW